jgi:hemerythrin superfamily protein
MTVPEKVKSATKPVESKEARSQARVKAKAIAAPGSWLEMVLKHHEQIDSAFAAVKSARDAAGRLEAQKRLAILLTGHSIAEESVLYPALAATDQKGHATMAYTQQAEAKIDMAELEKLAPMGHSYLEKLEQIHEAVAHHVFEEEGAWFPDLMRKAAPADQLQLAKRYMEEFERYVEGKTH